MTGWLDRVPSLVQAWFPGQEGGTALAEILFGDVNPSGRLPVTFERRWEDNPARDSYYAEPGTNRVVYRGCERAGTKPLFPFGHGLSYTTFEYSDVTIKPRAGGASVKGAAIALYEVSFKVKNAGDRVGADVAQVYVGGAPVCRDRQRN